MNIDDGIDDGTVIDGNIDDGNIIDDGSIINNDDNYTYRYVFWNAGFF